MPFLRLSPSTLRTSFRRTPFLTARPLSTTPTFRLKETANRDPSEIESKKQEQIDKQKKGEGHWHSELASKTEEHVKADRQDVDDHGEHIEELQKETAKEGEEGKLDKGH